MKIDLTKEQFESLLKAVYLGNWLAKCGEEESSEDDFDEIESYLLSHAKDFGLADYAEYDKEQKKYYPSEMLEESEEMEGFIRRYDDYTFWEKLIYNLAGRDMERKYGSTAIARWTPEEHLTKEQPFIEVYEKEFGSNGLRNLVIKPPKGN